MRRPALFSALLRHLGDIAAHWGRVRGWGWGGAAGGPGGGGGAVEGGR